MKTISYLSCLFCLLIFFSCENESIKASGEVISDIRNTDAFDAIEAEDAMDIFVSHGSEFKVEVRADDNLIDKIGTEVANSILKIKFTESLSIRNNATTEVYVFLPTLKRLKLEDAVDASLSGFTTLDELELDLRDASDLDLEGSATLLKATVSDASDLKGFDFTCDTCKVDLDAASEMDITCTQLLEGTVKAAAVLRYKGNPNITATTSSAGEIKNAN